MTRNFELRIVNYVQFTDTVDLPLVGKVQNYEAVDLYENEPINVTIQTVDIQNPTQRKLSYSGSFKIPATDKNNMLLAQTGLLNSALGTENDNLVEINLYNFPVSIELYADDIFLFKANMQLNSVLRTDGKVREYDVTLIADNYSLFTQLKDLNFSDPYTSSLFTEGAPQILPANWIWDSIILERWGSSFSMDRKKFFPTSLTASVTTFPVYIPQDTIKMINHVFESWDDNAKTNNFYWGFIDDGTNSSAKREPGIFLSDMASGTTFDYTKGFNPLETVKPYYYVSDIIRRIFRYLEYKLNGELYNINDLQGTGDGTATPVLGPQFPNYDKPSTGLPNLPFRLRFQSDLLNEWNDESLSVLDKLVLVTPDNTSYENGTFIIKVITNQVDSLTGYIKRIPIDFQTNGNSSWEVNSGLTRVVINSFAANAPFTSTDIEIEFNGVTLHTRNISVLSTFPIEINLVTENNVFTNSLPNKVNIKTILSDENLLDSYLHTYISVGDVGSPLTVKPSGGVPYYDERGPTRVYDLRRYLYPSLSDYDLASFCQEVFSLFNSKIDDPLFLSSGGEFQIKSYSEYYKTGLDFNATIRDISDIIDISSVELKQSLYKSLSIQYTAQEDDLSKSLIVNNTFNQSQFSYFKNYNKFKGYADKDLKIEFKSSQPIMLSCPDALDSDISGRWGIPSLFNFTETNGERIYSAYTNYKPMFLFNNGEKVYETGNSIVEFKLFNTRIFAAGATNTTTGSTGMSERPLPRFWPWLVNPFSGDLGPYEVIQNLAMSYNNEFQKGEIGWILGKNLDNVDEIITGYELNFKDQYDMINLKSVLTANIDISLIDLITLPLSTIFYLRENGELNYYVLNKISNYRLDDQRLAKAEFQEFDLITGNFGLYGNFESEISTNFGIANVRNDSNIAFVEVFLTYVIDPEELQAGYIDFSNDIAPRVVWLTTNSISGSRNAVLRLYDGNTIIDTFDMTGLTGTQKWKVEITEDSITATAV